MLFGRNITYRLIDGFVFEQIGPMGIQKVIGTLSGSHKRFHNGFIPNYTSVFFFGILLFLVGFVALPTCLEIFPGLDVFAVTASLSFPVLVTVLT
jgi:hypothetical protein|tara:strand:+ start:4019 stop:4303 length:285 start_codon:yes stop_codon:yes gene_type:complete